MFEKRHIRIYTVACNAFAISTLAYVAQLEKPSTWVYQRECDMLRTAANGCAGTVWLGSEHGSVAPTKRIRTSLHIYVYIFYSRLNLEYPYADSC